VSDRCQFIGGSFFDEVWAGADVYLLSSVIHDWDEGRRRESWRTAGARSAPVAGWSFVLPSSSEWHPGNVLDVLMLALSTGRERTEPEWKGLLEQAGFAITSITPSPRVSLIEAQPA
jgi:hypothetical protein